MDSKEREVRRNFQVRRFCDNGIQADADGSDDSIHHYHLENILLSPRRSCGLVSYVCTLKFRQSRSYLPENQRIISNRPNLCLAPT